MYCPIFFLSSFYLKGEIKRESTLTSLYIRWQILIHKDNGLQQKVLKNHDLNSTEDQKR